MKKIVIVFIGFALTAAASAETSIGFNFSGHSNFTYFEPEVVVDVSFEALEAFIGLGFAISDDRRHEDFPYSWLRLRVGAAPFVVKTEKLKVSIPLHLFWSKTDHGKESKYSDVNYGDWIAAEAGVKVARSFTDYFALYCGAYAQFFQVNVSDITRAGAVVVEAGKITHWFRDGYIELGARFYFKL
jgi:hypothetical protein